MYSTNDFFNFLLLLFTEKAVKAKLLRSLSTLSDKSDEGKHLAESFSRQISSQHSLRHHKKEVGIILIITLSM